MEFIKIFLDSCVVFKLFRQYIMWSNLSNSKLLQNDEYIYVISDYVIQEVIDNIEIKYKINWLEYVDWFLKITKFGIASFVWIDKNIYMYTKDTDDAKILYDCIKSNCKILLTDNVKDFKIDNIYNDFDILVRWYIMK